MDHVRLPDPRLVTPLKEQQRPAGWPRGAVRVLYVQRYVGPRGGGAQTTHDFWELTVTLRGRGLLLPGDVALRPDRCVLIPPGWGHRESAAARLDTIWIGLAGSWPGLPAAAPLLCDDPAGARLAEQAWVAAQQRGPTAGVEADGLVQALLARVLRLAAAGAQGASLVERALHYFEQHLHRRFSIAQLAAALDASEGHVYRQFRLVLGDTPVRRLTALRLARAQQLLRQTTWSVKQVAQAVGFADPLYFSRVFRRRVGRPPRAARQGGSG